ncbi:CARDB protein [Natrinema hispanicum]|uniref:CARDB protein n=1 Tax=Natrinema hispanicum TaxID=392421 RepID=A0A482Y757_9EURY|nr:CARDB domain-containing protein [Natrinema hispanicum]RZV06464.1 CARDB protein [Natrinema hispanicum]
MSSTKIPLTAAAICFLLALAVPTAAITIGESPGSDDVTLEPVDAEYATLKDGELVLEFEALNDCAETTFSEVFTIEVGDNADDVEAMGIDHDLEGVAFYADGSAITNDSRLELAAGDTKTVGVTVDTRSVQETTENFTITVQYTDNETGSEQSAGGASGTSLSGSPAIERTNLTVSPTTANAGEAVTVTATYRNDGDASGQTTAQLTVDGIVVDQRTIVLEPGEERTVTFERTMEWPGTHEISVSGAGSQSVTVGGPPIDVVNASVDSTTVTTGDSTTVRATVTNPTDRGVDRTLEVAVDGIVVDSRAVSIPANSERTVTFEREFESAGTYEIAVSGVTAGEVTVQDPAGLTLQNRELSPATTAALAPPATAGLLFLAVAANRRWAIIN